MSEFELPDGDEFASESLPPAAPLLGMDAMDALGPPQENSSYLE